MAELISAIKLAEELGIKNEMEADMVFNTYTTEMVVHDPTVGQVAKIKARGGRWVGGFDYETRGWHVQVQTWTKEQQARWADRGNGHQVGADIEALQQLGAIIKA